MSIFALIHPLFKFLLEFFKNSGRTRRVPNETGDKRILFKMFLFLSALSFVLNIQLIIVGLQINKRLQDYKASVENKKIVIKDLEICTANLDLQKSLLKSCTSKK